MAFVYIPSKGALERIELDERHGFTAAVKFYDLAENTDYQCEVTFGASAGTPIHLQVDYGNCRGKFKTPPKADNSKKFNFFLGSCNLHSLWIFNNPDRAYEELLSKSNDNDVSFMIHCGDQIYYDIPPNLTGPSVEKYRDKHLDAWSDSRPARKFLPRCRNT